MPFSLILVLISCKSGQNRTTTTLSVALGAPPTTLDPVKATDATGMRMVSLVYQGLVRIGSDLKPSSDLATSWSVKNNFYEFFISSDTTFSDGTPLNCDALLNSIKAYQNKRSPFRGAFKVITKPKCTLKADNQLHLSFYLQKASAKFLIADLPVLKIFKTTDKSLLGTGAFKVERTTPTESILKPNTYYANPQNYTLHINYIKDDFARFLKTYKGEIDIAPNSIPFEKIESFKTKNFKILEEASLSTSYLLVNFKNPLLNDLRLRKRIYQSIKIEDLIQNRFSNHVSLAKSLLPPSHPYFSHHLLKMGHTEPLSHKQETQLLTIKTSNSRQSIETGKIIAQRLREAGIPTRLQSFEWGTFYRDVKSGNYDLALMKWVGVVDPDQYNIAFHSQEHPPGRNRGYYSSASLDQVLDLGRRDFEFQKRKQHYDQAQNMVFKDLAILPLWHENQIHIVHPRVKGYEVHPMGDFSSFLNLSLKKGENL